MHLPMDLPVRHTIRELSLTRVARKMGLPISTVLRWMSQDRIPGTGRAHDWRVAQFEAAVNALRAEISGAIATKRG
jgi:hypothetical protein